MSRIANAPVTIPKGVEASLSDGAISVKGSKGNLNLSLHDLVAVAHDGEDLKVSAKDDSRQAGALAGTFRSLINNMVVGNNISFLINDDPRSKGFTPLLKFRKKIFKKWIIKKRIKLPLNNLFL